MSKTFEVATFKLEMEAFAKEIRQKGEDLLKQGFKSFLDKYPYVGSVSWTQYTIYFNDGDVCPFYINDFQLSIRPQEGEGYSQNKDDEFEIDMYGSDQEDCEYVTQECFDDLTSLEEGCKEIEDTVKLIFGDHVQITATREGFEIESYEDHH